MLEIRVDHVYPLAVRLTGPVHVSDNVPRKSHLLYPCDPLIDIGYYRHEEVAVCCYDLAQVGQEGVVDVMSAWGTVPWPVDIVGHPTTDIPLDERIHCNAPPVWAGLHRQDGM